MRILFLDPIKKLSLRERELQDAAARAHAARVAHDRASKRIKLRSSGSSPAKSPDSAATNQEAGPDVSKAIDAIQSMSIYPGFGNFRGELMDLLPKSSRHGDLEALDFFVGVTLAGIDVASEMFDSTGLFSFILPNLVSGVFSSSPILLSHDERTYMLKSSFTFGVQEQF